MFGAGYAGAEDRLLVMDLLRHVGRGTLTSFAGGAPGNRVLEQSVWRNSPYTEADLQAQVDALRLKGARGEQLYTDVHGTTSPASTPTSQRIAGWNYPGEYVLAGAWTPSPTKADRTVHMTDLIATAGVVGGLFGGGGGSRNPVRSGPGGRPGKVRRHREATRCGRRSAPRTTRRPCPTLHNGQSFPYGGAPPDATSAALPTPASVAPSPSPTTRPGGAAGRRTSTDPVLAGGLTNGGAHQGMSNAVVVSGAHTTTATRSPCSARRPATSRRKC